MLDRNNSWAYPSPSRHTSTSLVLLIYLLHFEPEKDTEIIFPSSSFKTEAKNTSFLKESFDSDVVMAFWKEQRILRLEGKQLNFKLMKEAWGRHWLIPWGTWQERTQLQLLQFHNFSEFMPFVIHRGFQCCNWKTKHVAKCQPAIKCSRLML